MFKLQACTVSVLARAGPTDRSVYTFSITLYALQACCEGGLSSLTIRLDLLALIGKTFELAIAGIQLFKQGLDSLLAHTKPYALPEFEFVVSFLRVCHQKSLEIVSG